MGFFFYVNLKLASFRNSHIFLVIINRQFYTFTAISNNCFPIAKTITIAGSITITTITTTIATTKTTTTINISFIMIMLLQGL